NSCCRRKGSQARDAFDPVTPAELAEFAFPEVGVLEELMCSPPASSAAATRSMPAASVLGGNAACRAAMAKSVAQVAGQILKSAAVLFQGKTTIQNFKLFPL
ncbi:unnamed protein product, partial [Polarella glacialis]